MFEIESPDDLPVLGVEQLGSTVSGATHHHHVVVRKGEGKYFFFVHLLEVDVLFLLNVEGGHPALVSGDVDEFVEGTPRSLRDLVVSGPFEGEDGVNGGTLVSLDFCLKALLSIVNSEDALGPLFLADDQDELV